MSGLVRKSDNTEKAVLFSEQAEQAVIGCVLVQGVVAYRKVAAKLNPKMFYVPRHRMIWKAFEALAEDRDASIDMVTTANQLNASGDLEKAGGRVYLADLHLSVSVVAPVEKYASIVGDYWRRRRVTQLMSEYITGTADLQLDLGDLTISVTRKLVEVACHSERKQFVSIQQVLSELGPEIERIQSGESEKDRMYFGLADVDREVIMMPTDLVTLCGYSQSGKTQLMLQVAVHNAVKRGKHVVLYSLETGRAKLGVRIAAYLGRIDSKRMWRKQGMDRDDFVSFASVKDKIGNASLVVSERSSLSIAQFQADMADLMIDAHPDLIIIDYLQLMAVSDNRYSGQRHMEIQQMTRALKEFAMEYHTTVVILSQLKKRDDQDTRRPAASDLRESGSIEQDSDVVIAPWHGRLGKEQVNQVGVLKNRLGTRVWVDVLWMRGQFHNVKRVLPEPDPEMPF